MTATTVSIHATKVSNCLHVEATGRDFIEDTEAASLAIAAFIAAHKPLAVFLDVRKVPGPVTFMDRVQLGEAAGRNLRGTPIAVLVTQDQIDPDRIGKVVACNRGANVEVFTDEPEARSWLQKYLEPQR